MVFNPGERVEGYTSFLWVVTSAGSLLLALIAHSQADRKVGYNAPRNPPYLRWFGEGVVFVAILALVYVGFAPTSEKSLEGCGNLAKKDDPNQIMLHFGGPAGAVSVAVLDPLCPACKAFDNRMRTSELDKKLSQDIVLFPLDKTCNWNVKESLHPGACAVAEAMLCSRDQAKQILEWAFANQEALVEEARARRTGARPSPASRCPPTRPPPAPRATRRRSPSRGSTRGSASPGRIGSSSSSSRPRPSRGRGRSS